MSYNEAGKWQGKYPTSVQCQQNLVFPCFLGRLSVFLEERRWFAGASKDSFLLVKLDTSTCSQIFELGPACFTLLAWWVICVRALNWKERNTASKSAKDVVDTRSTTGYQSLPRHCSCRRHLWYSHYCAPLSPAISLESMVELPGHTPSKTGGKGTALVSSFPSYASHALLLSLHLSLVLLCAVFSRALPISEVSEGIW